MRESVIVDIEKLVQGGYGLARLEGRTLFVRGTVPGERVEVRLGAARGQYQEAWVQRVVRASADRVAAPCEIYGRCGGCQFQHLNYGSELHWKKQILLETLKRIGKIDKPPLTEVVPSPSEYGSRGVVRFGLLRRGNGFALGFHEEGSARLVTATDCLLLPVVLREPVRLLQTRLGSMASLGCLVHSIELRASSTFDHQMLMIVRTDAAHQRATGRLTDLAQSLPGLVGLVVLGERNEQEQRWVEGQDWIAERLDDLLFRIGDRSSMQSNWAVTQFLVQTVIDWVEPKVGLRVLELFAGIGTLGLPLAKRGSLVTMVESNPWASADARRAAKGNHIGRCRFRVAPVEQFLTTESSIDYDVILLHPPRTGLSRDCLQGLLRSNQARLLYVSCDPPTLARDLRRLLDGGYRLVRLQSFDMFPRTAHLETLVELAR
ncbi:MAG TPA: 23S rRNA (uracil(1939)-C(5))-methyltransferase RlmD [Nitrospiraceae bacterium]|nr:23S rRNA (uracil(1939)-C(5))-methyltransferase RlmD [Nitrospiraceae bacterium]